MKNIKNIITLSYKLMSYNDEKIHSIVN